jgi:hypothetical protein
MRACKDEEKCKARRKHAWWGTLSPTGSQTHLCLILQHAAVLLVIDPHLVAILGLRRGRYLVSLGGRTSSGDCLPACAGGRERYCHRVERT